MQKINFKAFTLVELIVVITIVGILSTVGFVSYSNYLTGARDSNRISQMVKLSDSLQVYAASKSLPLPDDYISITASGAEDTIAYQGYVGIDVLETIDYTNGGTDPKDDSYYTYYLTKDRKELQLMALMEDQQSVASLDSVNDIHANFEDRFPKTYGRNLGVLVSAEEETLHTPAQDISTNISNTYLDIFHTEENYIADFGIKGTKIGTGGILGMQIIGGGNLAGRWSFDEGSGTTALDSSGNGGNGVFSGTSDPSYVTGINGTGLDFHGHVTTQGIGSSIIFSDNTDGYDTPFFTVAFWMQPDNQSDASGTSKHGHIVKNVASEGNEAIFEFSWNHSNPDHEQSCLLTMITGDWIETQIHGVLDISEWNHIACVYGDEYLSVYVNGERNNTKKIPEPIVRGGYDMAIGAGGRLENNNLGEINFYDGKLDEFYLFRKALSDDEIEILYLNSQ